MNLTAGLPLRSNGVGQPSAGRPYHAKRPHKKSRTGCRNCKTRKVKCDEARPSCRNCVLRNAPCIYPTVPPATPSTLTSSTPPSSLTPATSSLTATTSSTTTTAPPRQIPSTPDNSTETDSTCSPSDPPVAVVTEPLFIPATHNDPLDMKLLWFYTTTTYTSFVTRLDPRCSEIMQVTIPRHAFEHPFLMDTLLGFASLHLLHLRQTWINPSRAIHYCAHALEGYRRAVQRADPSTFPALVASSLLLTGLSSHAFRDDAANTNDLYLLDWIVVWRGIGLVINLISPHKLWEAGMAELFYRPRLDLPHAARHIPADLHVFTSPDPLAPDDPIRPDHLRAYRTALKHLGALYAELATAHGPNGPSGPRITLRVVTWLTFLPNLFISLARRRHPRALVILAHYAMFTKLPRDIWWVHGVGDRTIRDITRFLGPDWQCYLDVPSRVMGLTEQLDVARVITQDPTWTAEGRSCGGGGGGRGDWGFLCDEQTVPPGTGGSSETDGPHLTETVVESEELDPHVDEVVLSNPAITSHLSQQNMCDEE